MKALKITSIVLAFIILLWIAISLSKIASSVDTKRRPAIRTKTEVSGSVSVNEHSFKPNWVRIKE